MYLHVVVNKDIHSFALSIAIWTSLYTTEPTPKKWKMSLVCQVIDIMHIFFLQNNWMSKLHPARHLKKTAYMKS